IHPSTRCFASSQPRASRPQTADRRLAKHAATSTSRLLIECRHWHSPQPSHSSLASKRHQSILPLTRPLTTKTASRDTVHLLALP
ncbi:hypothetical protein BC831DRAFT_476371, partial [Entophlyctis helioformis]